MISFAYRLVGVGWSEAVISDGANEVTFSGISYLSDALGDLVTAVLLLLEGATQIEFSWEQEPGEYEWRLARHETQLSILVMRYEDSAGPRRSDDLGEIALQMQCSLREFAKSLFTQLTDLYITLGSEGYKERWKEHDFPVNEYRRLGALLGEEIANSKSEVD